MDDKLQQVRYLLTRQTTLVLATADGDAKLRSTPLFFIADDALRLYWFSSRKSIHGRNCARAPHASVAIFRNVRQWQNIRGVEMDGLVSVIGDGAVRRKLTQRYCARFTLVDDFTTIIQGSALYCFTPVWLRYLDNSRGFGFKFELKLPIIPSRSNSSRRDSGFTITSRTAQRE